MKMCDPEEVINVFLGFSIFSLVLKQRDEETSDNFLHHDLY